MSHSELSHPKLESWRVIVLFSIIIVVFLYYGFRLFSLQITSGEKYIAQAEENRTRNVTESTLRGIIYDRNGFVLARNVASYNVVITPADLPIDEGAIQEVYRRLSALIDIPVNLGEINDESVKLFKPCETDLGITQVVYIGDTNAPYSPVRIKCNVEQKVAMIIKEKKKDWPGVDIEIVQIREYPTGSLTAEIIGFLGPIPAALEEDFRAKGFVPGQDKVGYAGIESYLQDILGGKNGQRTVEVDVAGKEVRNLVDPIDPVPGQNVKLSIDARLQNAAKTSFINEMNFWNKYLNDIRISNGVVIALNPKTGEVLALVSYPTFENNRMARIIPAYYYEQLSRDPNRPLFNHAVSAEHPPGSVYKMAPALGILNENVVTPEQEVLCPGKITIMQKFSPNDPGTPQEFVCWNREGHGMVNYLTGVAQSCDVYWYKVGGGYQNEVPVGLNIWRMAEYAKAIGYGEITGIELPGEATGLIPDPNWKRLNLGENWATGDTYIATMGQGFVLSTALQVLVSIGTIANDGKYMRPTLVHEILDSQGNVVKPFKPDLKWDITVDPKINIYDKNNITTGEKKVVEKWVVQKAKEGMRKVIVDGTAAEQFADATYTSGGKTGTAEYCDNVAQSKNLCKPGNWPTHSWYSGYAPADDPEIAVVAFVYNGGEGASVAGPIVRRVIDAYFELKAIDQANQTP